MEMLPGRNLLTKWRTMSEDSKRNLVKQVAKYHAQLFRFQFSSIGNIFVNPANQVLSMEPPQHRVGDGTKQARQASQQRLPALGRLVSLVFFWGDRITQDVPRGPFINSEDWITGRLTLIITSQENILESSNDEDDIEDAQHAKDIGEILLKLLPSIISSNASTIEPTALFHDDLLMQNILVDVDGRSAVLSIGSMSRHYHYGELANYPHFLREET